MYYQGVMFILYTCNDLCVIRRVLRKKQNGFSLSPILFFFPRGEMSGRVVSYSVFHRPPNGMCMTLARNRVNNLFSRQNKLACLYFHCLFVTVLYLLVALFSGHC